MIIIKDDSYEGSIVENENDIIVTISSKLEYNYLMNRIADAKEVVYISDDEDSRCYKVTNPIAAIDFGHNTYAMQYSTKATKIQQLEAKNEELSEVIDSILIMMLEV